MPKTVDAIIDDILRREGGDVFTNRAADKGGPTKFGITAITLGRWRGLDRPARADEVEALQEPEARDIYYADYVAPWAFVPDPLRMLLIDWGVTTSHGRVVRLLQVALLELKCYSGLIDGVPGPLTKQATARAPQGELYKLVFQARIRFYVKLGFDEATRAFLKDNPKTQLHNVQGWVNRALEML